jgi:hypothetical protein
MSEELALDILGESDLVEVFPKGELGGKSSWEKTTPESSSSRKILAKILLQTPVESEFNAKGTENQEKITVLVAIIQNPEGTLLEADLKNEEVILWNGKKYTVRSTRKKPTKNSTYLKVWATYAG